MRPLSTRLRISAGQLAACALPATRVRKAAAARALWADPSYRTKVLAAQAKAKACPHYRARMRDTQRALVSGRIEDIYQRELARVQREWRPEGVEKAAA